MAGDSWVIYGTACRQDGGQHWASLIWHTRGRSICNIHMHIHACSLTHTQSLRVRWPGCSPRLRAITGQKQGDDRHWAFDNVSICCVCHSDSGSMLLRAWEKHAVQAMQSYTPLMSWQKRELDRQNIMQRGLTGGKNWSLKMQLHSGPLLKYKKKRFLHFRWTEVVFFCCVVMLFFMFGYYKQIWSHLAVKKSTIHQFNMV